MIIHRPHLCTKVQIWHPKYNTETGEPEVWISKQKVHHASPVMIIEFTKAKHLIGQRFCIKRAEAQKYKEVTNGKIPCYAVPMSALDSWSTSREVLQEIEDIGW